MKAWCKLPVKGEPVTSLTADRQGPHEQFSDFIYQLMTIAGRIFGNAEAGVDYVKQLVYKNANTDCQEAIRPYRKKTDLTGYIRLCSDIGPSYQLGLAMVDAMQGQSVRDFLASRDKKACFKCSNPGHFAKDCRAGNKSTQRQPGK